MATPSSIDERIARLEGSFEQIERRLGTLEQDVRAPRADFGPWVDRSDNRVSLAEGGLDRIENSFDRLFYWQLGLIGAIGASILATALSRLL